MVDHSHLCVLQSSIAWCHFCSWMGDQPGLCRESLPQIKKVYWCNLSLNNYLVLNNLIATKICRAVGWKSLNTYFCHSHHTASTFTLCNKTAQDDIQHIPIYYIVHWTWLNLNFNWYFRDVIFKCLSYFQIDS